MWPFQKQPTVSGASLVALTELSVLESERDVSKMIDSTLRVFRAYLRAHFRIDHQMTEHELEKALRRRPIRADVKKDIRHLLKRLAHCRYSSPKKHSREEILELIDQAKDIIAIL